MNTFRRTEAAPSRRRFTNLPDARAKARIDTVLRKVGRGLKPDVKSVGEGVHEARIGYGPGYRVYFGNDGDDLVVLLLCGDKRTQEADIATAKQYWADYRTRKSFPHVPQGTRHEPPLLRSDDQEA